MTTTPDAPVAQKPAAESAEEPEGFVGEGDFETLRPVSASQGRLRKVRDLIGVTDDVLAWTPEERTRLTWQGLIVGFTACMAAVSMGFFLTRVFGTAAVLPVALFWGMLIFALDSWLISSAHGATSGLKKLGLFVPRLLLAALIALVIAEPLVLRVFHAEIRQQALEDRQQEIVAYESLLTRCNPSTGAPNDDPDCAGNLLSVAGSPAAAQEELALKRKQRNELVERQIKPIETKLDDLERRARQECDGTGGTRRYGNGVNCKKNRKTFDDYTRTSGIDHLRRQLVDLNKEIDGVSGRVGTGVATYEQNLKARIARQVAERRTSATDIGVLQEVKALHQIARKDHNAAAALWVLRLLLIVVECAPVMTKLLDGTGKYDKLVAERLAANDRVHKRWVDALTSVQLSRIELKEAEAKEVIAGHLERVKDLERQRMLSAHRQRDEDDAAEKSKLKEQINAYAAQIRGTA
ncbi:DUF4407 domain-containing protein [Actinomadura sp. 1N219]|uniref:DUF4407 domain-containing protein n=1 Tax=Actinomadura sp. 1N219 TaxID=3375152 RepID=UPI0037B09CDA